MSHHPPKLFDKLLSAYCKPSLWEAIEGDLYEQFLLDVDRYNVKKARINYLFNAIAFLRYHRLRKNSKIQNNMSLLKNYTKVSIRDLRRNKVFTFINLTGLVAGMTVSLFMLQYVLFETSFDQFQDGYDRIYRVINDRYQNGELIQHGTITYPTIGPTMKKDFPEVESYTRMIPWGRNYLTIENEIHLANDVLIADEHFLSFFGYNLQSGDAKTSLDAPFKVVLTKSFAEKLVSDKAAIPQLINQQVTIYGPQSFLITGIVEDPPINSHMQFEFLISYKTFIAAEGEAADNSWEWSDFYHYIKLKEGIHADEVSHKVAEFGPRYFKDGEVSGSVEEFYLQPLTDVHLDTSMEYEFGNVTDGRIVWLMLSIAIFIIIIAWINYINLNTSRAIQRAKEVGIRKSIGAFKGQVVMQFFIETLVINGIALTASIALIILLQPAFNQLTGIELSLNELWVNEVGPFPFAVVLLIILIASLSLVAAYPALLVTRFSTQDILKGSFKLKGEIVWLRKGLVIFQFAIAVVLVSASISVKKQIDYMMDKDLGYDMKNTMAIYGPSQMRFDSSFFVKIDRFKKEVSNLGGVHMVSTSNRTFGSKMGRLFQITTSADPEAKNLVSNFLQTDHEFTSLYKIKTIAGRPFAATDHNLDGSKVRNILLNRSAASYFKFDSPERAIGESINFWGKDWIIIGVVEDFHQRSLHEKIEPITMIPYYSTYHGFAVKFESEPGEGLISAVENIYASMFPGNYFDYFFVENRFNENYEADIRASRIANIFTILSIMIATLGLYGLVSITLLRKTKEIGVRKVLGANLFQILTQLGKDFVMLILIAILIGGPISYLALDKWKAGYAYGPELNVGLIVLAAIVLIGLSMLTIIFQTTKITRNNPVESLRYE